MDTNKKIAVGVDIGGSHITSALVDLEKGEIIGNPVTTDVDHTSSAETIFAAWTDNLRLLLGEVGQEVKEIGMAFPGPFDYDKGISLMEHKFAAIYGINIGQTLSARLLEFPGLTFKFINDAGAFALGESTFGAAKDDDKVIVLTLGTGVGSGFVSGRKVIREGDDVPPGGEVWNLPFHEGIVDEAFSTRWIVGKYKELTGKTVQGAKDVSLRVGFEEEARQLFNEYGYRLAEFTIPWLKKFGCHTLVLGGNISRNLPFFQQSLHRAYGQAGLTVSVKGSVLLDKSAMLGAASLFL